MKQFTLRLDATQQRPMVLLKNSLTALLDTGAYIPIWTDDEDILAPLLFLRQREVVHFNRFKELYEYYKNKGY